MRKLSHREITAQRITRENIGNAPRIPIIGVLDNIRSLYNVGSIFRTSDGALVDRLFLTGYTPTPPRREIDKTALGAVETVPWEYFADPLDAVRTARNRGAVIVVLEHTTESRPFDDPVPLQFPVCLVVGNELTGISPAVVSQADMAWEIPMYGAKQSLNAAVAYGIAVFELVRRWRAK
jgi:tRNA G18 (ribose-2'-O)-methylase SpoU